MRADLVDVDELCVCVWFGDVGMEGGRRGETLGEEGLATTVTPQGGEREGHTHGHAYARTHARRR